MPMKPARAEQMAPRTNATAIIILDVAGSAVKARMAATTATKIARTRYSALRKAMAPSAMFLPMRCITSLPGSCLDTPADLTAIKTNASTPNRGTAMSIVETINVRKIYLLRREWFYLRAGS